MGFYEAIKFYNPTDEEFVGTWDSEPYVIKPKSSISVPQHIAEHFAKHLANKILQEQFKKLCSKHPILTDELLKTCANCKVKNGKIMSLYICKEREELYKILLPKEEPKVVEPMVQE